MKPILERYRDKQISINVSDPIKTELMTLFLVADDYFGEVNPENGYRAYYPYTAILGIYESLNGVLTINLNHFVLYKGSVGFSF